MAERCSGWRGAAAKRARGGYGSAPTVSTTPEAERNGTGGWRAAVLLQNWSHRPELIQDGWRTSPVLLLETVSVAPPGGNLSTGERSCTTRRGSSRAP